MTKRQKNRNLASAPNRSGLTRRPVLDAVFKSIKSQSVIAVALPIADDSEALKKVAKQLVQQEHLDVEGLNVSHELSSVFAHGRLVDAFSGKERIWRLRVLLAGDRRSGGPISKVVP
jgi:hypothetical protein